MRANDTRPEPEFAAEVVVAEALRDAANRGPSELVAEISPHARQTPRGKYPVARGGNRGRQSAAQTSSVAGRHTAFKCTLLLRSRLLRSIALPRPNVKCKPDTRGG